MDKKSAALEAEAAPIPSPATKGAGSRETGNSQNASKKRTVAQMTQGKEVPVADAKPVGSKRLRRTKDIEEEKKEVEVVQQPDVAQDEDKKMRSECPEEEVKGTSAAATTTATKSPADKSASPAAKKVQTKI